MQEEIIIDKFLKKISLKNKGALKLQDDVFFDKQKGIIISLDTFNNLGSGAIITSNLFIIWCTIKN